MTSSPFHYMPMAFATLSTVLLCLVAPAGTLSIEQSTLLRRHPDAELLQAAANETDEYVIVQEQPAMDLPFFSEDADRMAEMPLYHGFVGGHDSKHLNRLHGGRYRIPGAKVCDPQCKYTCGHNECDQACEPRCLPPKCETLCAKSADVCETRCAKPKCAVICPASVEKCPDGHCPKCRSLCAPPACTTSCSGSCHSVCTQPRCTWKCHVGKCPKPSCKMKCTGLEPCHDFPARNLTKVPLMPGMTIKSEDRASLDPKTLLKPPVAPPPPGVQAVPTDMGLQHIGSGHGEVPLQTTISPVQRLKMRWQAEDMTYANEKLLRR